jgi:molybdate transport system permease protein
LRAGHALSAVPDRRARRPATIRPAASRAFAVALFVALALVLTFLTLPVVAVFVDSSPGRLLSSLGEEGALEALRLSFLCTSIAIAIIVVVGTPAAYLLATRRFRGRATVVTLIELPLVLPPAVAGIGLLAALGPSGILGGVVADLGLELVLTTTGVVLALVFVASPFYLRQAQSAFEAVDPTWLDASRTLGASEARTLFAVAIPAAGAGLVSGLALAWGRALGEFGATLMFAGSFRGITQTVPLAIYERFANDFDSALALSAVLVAVSAALLLSIKLLTAMTWLGAARSG